MKDFMIEIIVASLLIGFIFAPLGCVVLWKKYVYFGDGLAHSSMLAAVLSVILDLPLIVPAIFITAIFAISIFKLKTNSGNNAIIGLTSNILMAIAVIISGLYAKNINIIGLLFGDILSITRGEIALLGMILIAVILFISIFYRSIILIVFSRDIAFARKVKVHLIELLFISLLSLSIICSIKMVGVLLVTSIIVIPAMSARIISSTPSMMIIFAIIIATIMNIAGMYFSFYSDLPFAPVIAASGGGVFFLLSIASAIYKKIYE